LVHDYVLQNRTTVGMSLLGKDLKNVSILDAKRLDF
jgi:hypothetical protein